MRPAARAMRAAVGDAAGDTGRGAGPHPPLRDAVRARSRHACALGIVLAIAVAGSIGAAPVPGGCDPTSGRRDQCSIIAADPLASADATGTLRTITATGSFDTGNAFFQSLGGNGRSCASCHRPEAAWTLTPENVQARFATSAGTDPVFRPVDAANSPVADVSTETARRAAYSMLLAKAVIRIGLPVPAGAEFTLAQVDDPYAFASAAQLSLFRRPLPATNLRFLAGVMWDDRENAAPFLPPLEAGANAALLRASLRTQALNATLGHAQAATAPDEAQLASIVEFELGLTTAQWRDRHAGLLSGGDAIGGPRVLANQQFHVGINDALGADPVAGGQAATMRLFDAWDAQAGSERAPARNAIARGERLFNTRPILISGVAGFNDVAGLPLVVGTCATCHDTPNVGSHSTSASMDIGTTDASERTGDMPLYTLQRRSDASLRQTTDPGRALISGRWDDIGKFKVPALRGLAGRAPYFHNGMAASLEEVIDFYERRFAMGLDPQEKSDLIAFMQAL
jgi:hypothetical protein